MAATKTPATILNAVTTTQTSSAIDCSGDYLQQIYVSISQVGTPTSAASVQPQWSPDGGTNYFNGYVYKTDLGAGTYYFTIDIPPTANRIRLVFTQQSGGTSSTCTAILGQLTG